MQGQHGRGHSLKYLSVIKHFTAMVALAALAAGCSENVVTSGSKALSDAKADQQVVDLPLAASSDQAAWLCPGGYGCACENDAACPSSGLCVADGKGPAHCAVPCPEGYCSDGEVCRPLPSAKDGGNWCIGKTAHLCDPCATTADCAIAGHPQARCVDYGSDGHFCGLACQGDAECGAGYHCGQVSTTDGNSAMQCVKSGVQPGQLGVCECSARAKSQKLEIVCGVGTCKGKRSCSDAGLAACSGAAPGNEECNGQDDDCDGQTDETSCSDNNPCTIDSCDLSKGCSHAPADSLPCSDKTACTEGDACKNGACQPGPEVNCDDANPCTIETCDPIKGCQTKFSDGKACDDGDACTKDEACSSGACASGKPLICDDKNPCTADTCSAGECTATPVDGAPCSDGSACTGADTCAGGKCAGTTLVCDDKNACTIDSCDPAKGCIYLPGPATACDDGNLCTTGETCQSGNCTGGTTQACANDNACATAACQPATGLCAIKKKADGTLCSDGKTCTAEDHCATGACVAKLSCDDKDACTADLCGLNGNCTHVPITTGNCNPAACVGVDCDDKNGCTIDGCDGSGCTHTAAVGQSCDDASLCTVGDVCSQQGKCAGASVICGDDNPCTTDSCDPLKGCSNTENSLPCDLGGCQAGACTAGSCVGTGQVGCDDKSPCTSDSCEASGCVHTPTGDGTGCDDSDACSSGDTCKGGVCAGTALDCTLPGNPCAVGQCEGSPGQCTVTKLNDGTSCDDSNTCTKADSCANGACGGSAVDCDDKNACTTDSCDKTAGCQHANASDGSSCSDSDACTVSDACTSGTCSGTAKVCDDKNPCTSDGCDLSVGCTVAAVSDGQTCDDGDTCTLSDACQSGKCTGNLGADAVSSLAGAGSSGYINGKGAAAKFTLPSAIAVGADGTLYIADAAANGAYIRKVLQDGTVTNLAGKGIDGFADASGALAQFWNPAGLAVDASGTVYVADRFNQRIRKITAIGVVTTLAGDAAEPGFLDTKAIGGYQDGQGTAARFDEPAAIALGPDGKLYVAEAANHKIRVVDSDGTVTTLAGSSQGYLDGTGTSAKFDAPQGIAVAANGTVYVADTGNNRIRAISGGVVTTFAGTGIYGYADDLLQNACIAAPAGMSIGSDGTLYATDAFHTIRALSSTVVTTLAGIGGASGYLDAAPLQAKFNGPLGVVWAGKGLWFVADTLNFRVRKLLSPTLACKP